MNEKIKELALQAGGSHYPDVGGKTLEKFAELIVKECADVAKRFHKNNKEYDAGLAIEQHFGAEL